MTRHAHSSDAPWWSGRQALLAVLLTLAGLAAWWRLETTSDEDAVRGPRARLPDYVVKDFSAVETDATGRPSRRLVAAELRHYTEEDLSELDQPRMELYQAEGPPWQARAATGTVFAGGAQVRLSGAVQLERAADASTRPAHLETERIDIWREQAVAETDLPVRIHSDGDTLHANGMRLWYQEPTRSTFHGRARIRFAPEEERQP